MKYHQPKFTYLCIRTGCNKLVKTSNTELSGVGEYCDTCKARIKQQSLELIGKKLVIVQDQAKRQSKYRKAKYAKTKLETLRADLSLVELSKSSAKKTAAKIALNAQILKE